ncbi:S1C family serine protease [Luteolibacter luteus]|uniref:PDZ domain-containing protein n=1 Tax=Luteolibacter luteus TaxID=2728835 RepID=A0A858RS75_9BACT|nr:PDZ domain-containing protein [Luteolibacter luteus]QJE98793.1 PDZ domain-containing protein [Luteolibacter luteus]
MSLAATAFAIEAPDSAAPIPPQVSPEEAAAPPVEIPHADAVEIPVRPAQGEARAEAAAHGYLGVGGSKLPALVGEHLKLAEGEGVVVRTLDPDGPAAKAGIAQNDIITKVAGKAVGSHDDLRASVAGLKPGEEVAIDFIHRGESKNVSVALGATPAQPGAVAGAEVKPLDNLMMNGMPPDQLKRMREAIEQNMKAFEALDGEDVNAGALMGEGIHKRVQQMLQGMQMPEMPDVGQFEKGGLEMNGTSSSSIRMLDENGSVELKSQDGNKHVRVFDKDGKVEWEGPYDTAADKEAVPKDVRERIDRLNIDMDFKGNGLRLRMAPRGAR